MENSKFIYNYLTLQDVEDIQTKFKVCFFSVEDMSRPSLDLVLYVVNMARERNELPLLEKKTAKFKEVSEEWGNFFRPSIPATGTKTPLDASIPV